MTLTCKLKFDFNFTDPWRHEEITCPPCPLASDVEN